MMKFPRILLFIFLCALPLLVLAYFLTPGIIHHRQKLTLEEKLILNETRNRQSAIIQELTNALDNDPYSFRLHYYFVFYYSQLDDRNAKLSKVGVEHFFGKDPGSYYEKLIFSTNNSEREIGYFGTAFLMLRRNSGNAGAALELTSKIVSDNAFVHLLLADIHDALFDITTVQKELLTAHSEAADLIINKKLFDFYYVNNLYEQAFMLMKDLSYDHLQVNIHKRRKVAQSVSLRAWLTETYAPFYYQVTRAATLMALVIFFVWFIFIFWLDVFREVKAYHLLLLLLIAVVFNPLCVFFYDLVHLWLDAEPETFIYFVGVVGLLEESMKIIPLVILLLFVKPKSVSAFEFFVLSAISALVFATMENILYLNNYYDVSIASVRSGITALLHLGTTAIATYGFMLYHYRKKSFWWIPVTFVIAVFLHGIVDTFFTNYFSFFVYVIMVPLSFIWSSIANNSLNISPRFDAGINFRMERSVAFFIMGFIVVLIAEMMATDLKYDDDFAQRNYLSSINAVGPLVLIFAFNLSRIELAENHWSFLDIGGVRSMGGKNQFSAMKFSAVLINAMGNPDAVRKATFTVGEKRISDEGDVSFLVINESTDEWMLLFFKEEEDNFYDFNVMAMLHLIPGHELPVNGFAKKSFPFYGIYKIQPIH